MENGKIFSEHLQVYDLKKLLLQDYYSAVLLVAKFMCRPLEMIPALKDTIKSYRHQLDKSELIAISQG